MDMIPILTPLFHEKTKLKKQITLMRVFRFVVVEGRKDIGLAIPRHP